MPITLNTRDTGFETAFAAFLAGKRENAADVDAAVAEIIEQVATRGDAALIEYTKRFDRIDLAPATLRLTQAEIAAGAGAAPCRRAHRELPSAPASCTDRLRRSRRRSARFALASDYCGRSLCAGRHRRVSLLGADECDPRQGRRR